MRAADRSRNVNTHRHGQAPSENNIGVAAVHHFARDGGNARKQFRHRDGAAAEQNQHHRSEEFGGEFLSFREVHNLEG